MTARSAHEGAATLTMSFIHACARRNLSHMDIAAHTHYSLASFLNGGMMLVNG